MENLEWGMFRQALSGHGKSIDAVSIGCGIVCTYGNAVLNPQAVHFVHCCLKNSVLQIDKLDTLDAGTREYQAQRVQDQLQELHPVDAVFKISARTGDGIAELKSFLLAGYSLFLALLLGEPLCNLKSSN